MRHHLSRVVSVCVSAVCAFAYACEFSEDLSAEEQAGTQLNGSNINGSNINGSNINGMSLRGFLVEGAMLNGTSLSNLRVEKGELVAEQGSSTLRGEALEDARLVGQAQSAGGSPGTTYIAYRITDIQPELSIYDPTSTGSTFLYTLDRWDSTAGTWVAACPQDVDGNRVAIPLTAEWDDTGNRTDSPSLFTLACTSGVIAKCYRWGYRPWVTGYGDLASRHWACTRLARADFCGDGTPHTVDGTIINIWDDLPAPGPIQAYATGTGMVYDSGWNTGGALCLSEARYQQLGWLSSSPCPGRLPPLSTATTCESMAQTKQLFPQAILFKESFITP